MVFPDGILYHKQKGVVRTPKVNFIFNEIPLLVSYLAEKEKGDSSKNRLKSSYVPFAGRSSNCVLGDLKSIWTDF